MHTLMLIMTVTTLIANLLLVSVSFWVIILFLEKSKKQLIVSLSSAIEEYRAMTSTIKEIVWLCWLLAYMRVFLSYPTPMYCDNMSTCYSDCS